MTFQERKKYIQIEIAMPNPLFNFCIALLLYLCLYNYTVKLCLDLLDMNHLNMYYRGVISRQLFPLDFV